MSGEPRAFAVGPGEAETARSPIGGDVTFIARGEQTNGAFTVLEIAIPPGEGPPLHVHTREDESVYVLAGELRWKLDRELRATPAGSFVFIPRGLAHTFQNTGEEPGRMLVTFTPAGMEDFLGRFAELTDFDLDTFRRVAAEHGMEVVGPPLAESDPLS
jgi:quercetin dioxygenase-like cupin family protein